MGTAFNFYALLPGVPGVLARVMQGHGPRDAGQMSGPKKKGSIKNALVIKRADASCDTRPASRVVDRLRSPLALPQL